MNLQQLRIIRETVRRNFNLTEVANALFTSQPGVSKHIKDLEDELGVELFVRGEQVWFSEVSPRPHDTGMVTMATQWQNEFELHARAILGLPVDTALKSARLDGDFVVFLIGMRINRPWAVHRWWPVASAIRSSCARRSERIVRARS